MEVMSVETDDMEDGLSQEELEKLKEDIIDRKVNTAEHTTAQLKVKKVLLIIAPFIVLSIIGIGIGLFMYVGAGSAVTSTVIGIIGFVFLVYMYIYDDTPS